MSERKQLKARFQIGSVHGKVHYAAEEKVFHVSDIPDRALAARREVKHLKRPDILGLERPKWNSSTYVPDVACKRRMRTLATAPRDGYVYNYRAEVLPPPAEAVSSAEARTASALLRTAPKGATAHRPSDSLVAGAVRQLKRVEEMPVHPALEGKPAWDFGTRLERKDFDAIARKTERARVRNSRRYRMKTEYRDPVTREKDFVHKLRAEKIASREGTAGSVRRSGRGGGSGEEAAARKRRKKKLARRIVKSYKHTGTWAYSALEGRFVWSCCMADRESSRGCVAIARDLDALNTVGP
eukprot:PLAT9828.1.p1 GENE.PLAT9828.1~~PLAT9828.1.p1  ORF type:complete len:298 (-),score=96.69 PLAT9828.1:90-983(-)